MASVKLGRDKDNRDMMQITTQTFSYTFECHIRKDIVPNDEQLGFSDLLRVCNRFMKVHGLSDLMEKQVELVEDHPAAGKANAQLLSNLEALLAKTKAWKLEMRDIMDRVRDHVHDTD
ncbi:MAG: hypothetical protein Q9168_006884 [Polycauliona sp. 1 TL-2023]